MTRVLIVEDELLIARHWQLRLAAAGYEVCRPVARGDQAVEAAGRLRPDVIIIDIRLAGKMDGLEAARQIRAFSSAVMIFATGCPEPSLREQAMALRPAAYLIKPIDMEELEQAVGAAVRSR